MEIVIIITRQHMLAMESGIDLLNERYQQSLVQQTPYKRVLNYLKETI